MTMVSVFDCFPQTHFRSVYIRVETLILALTEQILILTNAPIIFHTLIPSVSVSLNKTIHSLSQTHSSLKKPPISSFLLNPGTLFAYKSANRSHYETPKNYPKNYKARRSIGRSLYDGSKQRRNDYLPRRNRTR